MGFVGTVVYGGWDIWQNVQSGRPWHENLGVESAKGFLIGATLGMAAPALAGSETAVGIEGVTAAGAATMAQKGARAVWDASRAAHIFRDAAGHASPGTAASQERFIRLFQEVASDPANANIGVVKSQEAVAAGVQGFAKVFRTGEQVWVHVRNGMIIDAGVNPTGAVR
jgi:hypothetical protein